MKESTYYSQTGADVSVVRTGDPLLCCTYYFIVYLVSLWKLIVGNPITIDWIKSVKKNHFKSAEVRIFVGYFKFGTQDSLGWQQDFCNLEHFFLRHSSSKSIPGVAMPSRCPDKSSLKSTLSALSFCWSQLINWGTEFFNNKNFFWVSFFFFERKWKIKYN